LSSAGSADQTFKIDYVDYLLNKKRAGVVQLPNCLIYLLPPIEEAMKIYSFGEKELLGIVVT
jgi:hypothetical protein